MDKNNNPFLLVFILLFSCFNNCSQYTNYNFISLYLDTSKQNILGTPFDRFSQDLKLKEIKWDEGYTNKENSQLRIYHYKGFYLLVFIEKKLPYFKQSYNFEELNRNGIWYIDSFYPSLHNDGIFDSKKRMKEYWRNLWKN